MKISIFILCTVIMVQSSAAYAEYVESVEDSVMRAEILGENDGKRFIASAHESYQPEKAREECTVMFTEKWVEHFKEKGFSTSDEVAAAYVEWCVKGYNRAKGQ